MAADVWGWFGNRSSGEGQEFEVPETPWTLQAWDRASEYIMDAQPYVPPAGGTPTRMLMGVGG